MKFWKNYLYNHRGMILVGLGIMLIFSLVLLLYGLPWVALLYPNLLCMFFGALTLVLNGLRRKESWELLDRVATLSYELLEQSLPEPDSWQTVQYETMVHGLCDACRSLRAEAERRDRDRMDYYTAWVHQIKTPISSMRLRLQNEDSSQSRALSAELLRIEQYVEMALAYQRMESIDTDYVFRSVQVDDVLREVLKRLAGSFILRGLKLSFTPTNLRVVSDEKWLAFVLEQILSNALKYTPSGTVSIYMEEPNVLCIRDTGMGIAPEDMPRVMERGYTGANGRQDHRATGIGLYLCKCILDNLNHGIGLESVPGQGTTVRLDFSQNRDRIE